MEPKANSGVDKPGRRLLVTATDRSLVKPGATVTHFLNVVCRRRSGRGHDIKTAGGRRRTKDVDRRWLGISEVGRACKPQRRLWRRAGSGASRRVVFYRLLAFCFLFIYLMAKAQMMIPMI